MDIIVKPLVTEKMTQQTERYQRYGFVVNRRATKTQIKQAVESLFEVEVDAVRVLNTKGKTKRAGMRMGRRKNWKKAYVRVKSGQSIEFIGGE